MRDNGEQNLGNSWLFRLLLNLLGYATILIPGIILYLYVKKSKLSEKSGEFRAYIILIKLIDQ